MKTYKELKKALMEGYLTEMRKARCCDDDYYRKEAGQLVVLSNGGYFVVRKSRIETEFCFGYSTDYSGHEQSDAEATRSAFAKNGEAFKNANLRAIDETIAGLKFGMCDYQRVPVLVRTEYCGQTEPLNVWELRWTRLCDLLEKYGPMNEEQIKAKMVSPEDCEIILGAYNAERESLCKRLDAYLKRYGTSKLHTWTYWRDE